MFRSFSNDTLASFDDIKLCEFCNNGDDSAWFVIMSRYYSLVKILSHKYVNQYLELDDLMQEGFLGLLNAVNTFNSTKKVNFKTYAKVCILNKIKNFAKTFNTQKAKIFQSSVGTLENEVETVADSKLKSPESLFIQKEEYQKLVNSINSDLSSFERKVLILYLDGFSYLSISRNLDVSIKSINNAMVRIRKKLQQ
jgi:RNA polymerase sporulation-specific sigma factor